MPTTTTDYRCIHCTFTSPNHVEAMNHDRAHNMPVGYAFTAGTIFVFYGPTVIESFPHS